MEADDPFEEDAAALGGLLPADDRLWRHPSELGPALMAPPPRRTRSPWTVAMAAGTAGALLTVGAVYLAGGLGRSVIERRVVEREAVRPIVDLGLPASDVVTIAEEASPSIVRLEIDGGRASGSGVVFRDDGYILTNHHVVDRADDIEVVLADGTSLDGIVVGSDAETDVAVVKVERSGLPVALLGAAVGLRVGEPAIAIGSPLGLEGGPSVTAGVVSALGRSVRAENGVWLRDLIQTDAPIAPGSSGGALLDANGAVIGITTAIAVSEVGAEGLGFATPIEVAKAVADDLIATGEVTRAWLGIEARDLDRSTADELGVRGGARLARVVDDSPAALAGLREGDVILRLGEREVVSMSALVILLRTFEAGEAVTIELARDGERSSVEVTLAERPANPS